LTRYQAEPWCPAVRPCGTATRPIGSASPSLNDRHSAGATASLTDLGPGSRDGRACRLHRGHRCDRSAIVAATRLRSSNEKTNRLIRQYLSTGGNRGVTSSHMGCSRRRRGPGPEQARRRIRIRRPHRPPAMRWFAK